MRKYKHIKLLPIAALLLALVSCDGKSRLEASIVEANNLCPMHVGEGLTISGITDEGDEIVYLCRCDEALLGHSVDDWNTPAEKEVIKNRIIAEIEQSASSYNVHETVRLCRKNHRGIKLRYIGNHTGSICEITLYEP